MPDFPIVDAHVHLWDPAAMRMAWIEGNAVLGRPYTPADYRQHTAGVDVAAYVYVQVEVEPAYALSEVRWAAGQAALDPRLSGIVAYAPLGDGGPARTYLDDLVKLSPLVRGVRQVTQGIPDVDFVARPRFLEAARALPGYGLSCDICVKHPQMAAVVRLVESCPDTAFVLDHIGKPDIAHGLVEPWRTHIRRLSEMPNVCCKVSGMVTEAHHQRWATNDLRPFAEAVLEAFGEDRVMFGGDWPVVLEASPYTRWVQTLDSLTATLSPGQQRKLWSENARRFYRL
jgi:L-fuconolactonase